MSALRTSILFGFAAAISLVSACSLDPISTQAPRSSSARPLGIYSTHLEKDIESQALPALERNAFKREYRFYDAVEPGFLFQSTRVEQAEIDAGKFIASDLFQLGAQLFNVNFTADIGFGGKDTPKLMRFHKGKRGGPDATRCASCHWRGGPAGAGDAADNAYVDGDGERQASALARNPKSLAGAGIVELLGREMTADLHAQRDAMLAKAKSTGKPVRDKLTSKGVSFGELEVLPNGAIIGTDLQGVDFDLVVKPFGWKGRFASIRDIVEEELLIHHGMQSTFVAAHAAPERVGPFGGTDPDGDGVSNEITEGQVSALTLFVAMQEVPIVAPPTDGDQMFLLAQGEQVFTSFGCDTCHVRSLPLSSTRYVLTNRAGGRSTEVDLATEAAEPRLAKAATDGAYRAYLYSDLKRHDMGLELADPRAEQDVRRPEFLTPPLWGIARSRPYLHDARAQTIGYAILAHGGEGKASADAYANASEQERAALRTFLTALVRARRLDVP